MRALHTARRAVDIFEMARWARHARPSVRARVAEIASTVLHHRACLGRHGIGGARQARAAIGGGVAIRAAAVAGVCGPASRRQVLAGLALGGSHLSPCTSLPRTPRRSLRPGPCTRHCIDTPSRSRSRLLQKTARGTPRTCCCLPRPPLSSTCPLHTQCTLQTHSLLCTCPDRTPRKALRWGRCSPRHTGTFARRCFGPEMWSLQGTSRSCRVRQQPPPPNRFLICSWYSLRCQLWA